MSEDNIVTRKIQFSSGRQMVRGTLVVPKGRKGKCPGVIFFHGMTSSENSYIPIAEMLARRGVAALTLSIRGHGASDGDFSKLTVADGVQDGIAAYDFFAGQNEVDPSRIGLCGTSVGASIAACVSAERPVSSLVVRAPAAYDDAMMHMHYPAIMAAESHIFGDIKDPGKTPAIKAIACFAGDLLVITSENDAVIPVSISSRYFSGATQSHSRRQVVIAGATHRLDKEKWRKQFVDETIGWFVKTL
jgi:hypothetical protein